MPLGVGCIQRLSDQRKEPVIPWLNEFPALGSEQLSALRRAVDGGFRQFTRDHGEALENLFNPLREFLLASERLLTLSPWPLVIGGIAMIAWLASRSLRIVVGTVITLLLILNPAVTNPQGVGFGSAKVAACG